MIKNLLLALIILFSCSQVYAFENYIIISDYPIETYAIKDYTIANLTRDIADSDAALILTPIKVGNTTIYINTNKQTLKFDITVKPDSTVIQNVDGLTFFLLDEVTEPQTSEKQNSTETNGTVEDERPEIRGAK